MGAELHPIPKADIPRAERRSFWTTTLAVFVDEGHEAAYVDLAGRKPITAYQGLVKAAKRMGLADRVGVSIRGGDVYLYAKNETTYGRD